MIDAVAMEPHFVDHLAPIWSLLPDRGRFFVESVNPPLVAAAAARGIVAEGLDGFAIRSQSRPPKANPGAGPIALTASIGDIKLARRLGYRRFVFLEHGAGQSYSPTGHNGLESSYAGGPDREDVELFLVPNDHAAAMWRTAYPSARVEIVGCPRLDDLPRRQPGPPTVAISFHWPTPSALPPEAGNAVSDFLPALPALAKRYNLIGHAHPRHARDMAREYRRLGIEFVPSFDDVCRRADLYVCDNSSTIFEFASTGRPVVLMNSRRYRKHVHHGLRFWDAATVGLQVDSPAEMFEAIDRSLLDPPELQQAREAALSLVYGVRTNGAAYAATAITDWLAS